jgi:hypothetical protein
VYRASPKGRSCGAASAPANPTGAQPNNDLRVIGTVVFIYGDQSNFINTVIGGIATGAFVGIEIVPGMPSLSEFTIVRTFH